MGQTVPSCEPAFLRRVFDADAGCHGDPVGGRIGGANIGLTPSVAGEDESGPAPLRRELLAETSGRGVLPHLVFPNLFGLELEGSGLADGVQGYGHQHDDHQGDGALEHSILLQFGSFSYCRDYDEHYFI